MASRAYYNEHDPYAAAWLRSLISAGHIAPGDVDERDIRDVRPSDLTGYTQCHFFAGIGVWSHALRLAGWSDDRPAWTGSCPCQPFSAAGKGGGFDDERHLWPAFHHLIRECRPAVVLGEQVASKDGLAWLDLVQADLEGTGYASAAVDLCAAGVGAPHIRQRLWWVAERGVGLADANDAGLEGRGRTEECPVEFAAGPGGLAGGLAEPDGRERDRLANGEGCERDRSSTGRQQGDREPEPPRNVGGLADATRSGRREERADAGRQPVGNRQEGIAAGSRTGSGDSRPRPADGFWRDADWLFCRDGKWRPVEARPQQMVDGSAESLGRVRPEIIAEAEEAVNAYSMEAEVSPAAYLRAVREVLGAEAKRCWPTGGIPGLHEAPFLLALLRQFEVQGWRFAEGEALSREKTAGPKVRSLRIDGAVAGAPCERGLDGQQAGEHSDFVYFLPPLLARLAHQAWGQAYETYAEIGFPLGKNAPARVGRLRAYGNAIVAQAAQAFIEAYIETCRDCR